MINHLTLKNVGPTPELNLTLSQRINILTGDNGLGKSFLLDIIWWGLTRTWAQDVNPKLKSGYMAKPRNIKDKATIHFELTGKSQRRSTYSADYIPREENWVGKKGRPVNPGLVIYTMSDGSFALWDPALNYWTDTDNRKEKAQVFSQSEIWDGFSNENSHTYFNGLLRDWELWQTAQTPQFFQLKEVLATLSTEDEPLELGELALFRLNDSRLYPTLNTSSNKNVLFPHLSSGIKRIVTLTYFLVYAWKRHCDAAKSLGEEPTNQITFLIDEMEAHLHPKWQRQIVPAILKVMSIFSEQTNVQLITATHSPLVMLSLEPVFDESKDTWLDMNLTKDGNVSVKTEVFSKYGTANTWLESEAFDLLQPRSLDAEKLILLLKTHFNESEVNVTEILKLWKKLIKILSPDDLELLYWQQLLQRKGIL